MLPRRDDSLFNVSAFDPVVPSDNSDDCQPSIIIVLIYRTRCHARSL
jgi:hypothetical protein